MDEDLRRNDDKLLHEFYGEWKEFRKSYDANQTEASGWRATTDKRLASVDDFLSELRPPHKAAVFLIRTLGVLGLGAAFAGAVHLVKNHLRFFL